MERFLQLIPRLDADCYESLLQIEFLTNENTKEMVLDFIQKALYKESIILVLDDYHLVNRSEFNSFIEYLLWNEMPELHIILTACYTRLENLDELALKGYIKYIQKDALEFTSEEIKAYYRLCGVSLQEKEIKIFTIIQKGGLVPYIF